MRQTYKTALLWICILALFLALWRIFDRTPAPAFDTLRADLDARRVVAVRLQADGDRARAEVQLRGGRTYTTQEVAIAEALEVVQAAEVPYSIGAGTLPSIWALAATWLPALFVAGLLFFFFRSLRNPAKNPTMVQLVNARIDVQQPPPAAPELSGLTAARERLVAAVEALKKGAPGPRKILLSGPPGTGKTTLLRWLSAVTGVRSVIVPSSDTNYLFTGIAAARVRRIFELAGEHAPCLAVIEDVDALAYRRPPPTQDPLDPRRNAELELGFVELCHHLDGVRELPPRVLFVATTSRADRLDEALTRPGRLDLHLALAADGSVEVIDVQRGAAAAAAGG